MIVQDLKRGVSLCVLRHTHSEKPWVSDAFPDGKRVGIPVFANAASPFAEGIVSPLVPAVKGVSAESAGIEKPFK